MEIKRYGNIDMNLERWNDQMYNLHPTPYYGFAGVIESKRVRTILKNGKDRHQRFCLRTELLQN